MVTAEKGGSTSIQQKLLNIDSARGQPPVPSKRYLVQNANCVKAEGPPRDPCPCQNAGPGLGSGNSETLSLVPRPSLLPESH